MNQEIEIEYKALLTKKTFYHILKTLDFPEIPFTQINYYFETPDLILKEHNSALRIRKKNTNYIVTLKEPHPNGILETHDHISEVDFNNAIHTNQLNAPNCLKQLQKKQISFENITYMGSLTTERYEYTEEELIYVLDKSFYNDHIDYELEIEAPSQKVGSKVFNKLSTQFNIPKKSPVTKIERFFKTL